MRKRSTQDLIARTHNTARFFVEHPQLSWISLLGLLIWGVYGYFHMPQRKDPEIAIRVAVASCSYPGATAEQVEQLITRPIEDTIAQNKRIHPGTPGDYGIRSTSFPGQSVVMVQLAEDVKNPREQFSDIDLRLRALDSRLPKGAGPIVLQSDFGDTAALMLTVASPPVDATEVALRAQEMRTALLRVRGHAPEGGTGHTAILYAYPMTLSPQSMRSITELFLRFAEREHALENATLVEGNGFMGVDGASSWSDAQLQHLLDRFITEDLPAGSIDPDVWPPIVVRDPATIDARLTAVAGPKYTYAQLDDYTDLLARSLLGLAQTSRVDRTGVLPQQITLNYSQQQLGALGLEPGDLSRILAARNITAPGGEIESGPESFVVNASSEYTAARSIGDTIVGTTHAGQSNSHAPIYLRDLARINQGYQSPPQLLNFYTYADRDGKLHRLRAITINVYMRPGEQIAAFGAAVDSKLKDARAWLPSDIVLERTSDQPLQVRQNIHLFMQALFEAILLVIAVSLIGFWDWRSALLMALSMPITLAMTFGLAHAVGVDLQQVSIATLIIALGLLVDDPVVANDAIKREIAAGVRPLDAAWTGPTKLATAIVFATATNTIAYLPFLMIKGNTGDFLYSLPIVMTAALLSSRLVSMTFIPLIARYLLKPCSKRERTLEEKRASSFYSWYQKAVGAAIQHRWKTLGGAVVLMLLGLALATTLKPQFFPDDVQYWSYIDLWLPNGTPTSQTAEAAAKAETIVGRVVAQYAKQHHAGPDAESGNGESNLWGSGRGSQLLDSITSFVGGGGPRFWFSISPEPPQANYAELILRVTNKGATPELAGPLQSALTRELPGVKAIVHQLQINPVRYPVEVRISSTSDVDPANEPADNAMLRSLAAQAVEILQRTPGTAVVLSDWLNPTPEIQLVPNVDRANLAGLTDVDIARAVLAATSGLPVTTLLEGDRQIPVVARLEPQQRATVGDLGSVYVSAWNGAEKIPLASVAQPVLRETAGRICRQDHFRTVGVHAFPMHGELPSQILKRAMPQLDRLRRNLPPGYRMVIGGEQAKQDQGFANLAVVLLISAAGIYAALLLQFRSGVKPLIVFAAVPFGIVGALLGLVVMRVSFGFMAFLGIASLIGVIVSHIIVLFDYIEELRAAGEPLEQALKDAGIERLRPVLITVSATIFALIPLALHGGPLWKPLCYAQTGGLAVATFITLLLVPVLYSIAVLDLKIIRWEADEEEDRA